MRLRIKALLCLCHINRCNPLGIVQGYRQWADGTSTLYDIDGVVPRPSR